MKRENIDIRRAMLENGITFQELANAIGYRRTSLSRLLRKPVTSEKREMLEQGIERCLRDGSS